jgi:hypothetical protein
VVGQCRKHPQSDTWKACYASRDVAKTVDETAASFQALSVYLPFLASVTTCQRWRARSSASSTDIMILAVLVPEVRPNGYKVTFGSTGSPSSSICGGLEVTRAGKSNSNWLRNICMGAKHSGNNGQSSPFRPQRASVMGHAVARVCILPAVVRCALNRLSDCAPAKCFHPSISADPGTPSIPALVNTDAASERSMFVVAGV